MEETQALLWDIATHDEVKMLARRLEIARLVNEGHPYLEITHKLGTGTITIGWVKRALAKEGSGFKLALEKLKKDR
jgi:TrpR-related protein YerC/YecD